MTVTYKRLEQTLTDLLEDLQILAGEKMQIPSSSVSWQDVAGTASVNAFALAKMLEQARKGNHESCLTFPSPSDIINPSEETDV